jgi:hypothetical protein
MRLAKSPGMLGSSLALLALSVAPSAVSVDTTSAPVAPAISEAAPNPPFEPPRGARVYIGSGVTVPLGRIDQTRGTLASRAAWMLPVTVSMGYTRERFYFGGYFEGALGRSDGGGEPECAATRCTFTQLKFGFEATHALLPTRVSPFIGYGIGFEIASAQIGSPASRSHPTPLELSATYYGPELARASFGVDIHTSPSFVLTPFVGCSLGTYLWWTKYVKATQEDDGGAIDQKAFHGTILIGLRVGGPAFGR